MILGMFFRQCGNYGFFFFFFSVYEGVIMKCPCKVYTQTESSIFNSINRNQSKEATLTSRGGSSEREENAGLVCQTQKRGSSPFAA